MSENEQSKPVHDVSLFSLQDNLLIWNKLYLTFL
jgi:hypothetical protein